MRNELLGNIFSKEELVHFAMFGEELASGSRHADNIAPCLLVELRWLNLQNLLILFRFSFCQICMLQRCILRLR